MRRKVLSENRFSEARPGWDEPGGQVELTRGGAVLSPKRGERASLRGAGVHTRNGDEIELRFRLVGKPKGTLGLGFAGGMEHATAELDFTKRRVTLSTSDWTRPQPVSRGAFRLAAKRDHVLRLVKKESDASRGKLIRNADISVHLDGKNLLEVEDLDILPEIGVGLSVSGTVVVLRRFGHRGVPSGIPERLRLGGWQVINRPSIEENLASIKRGLRAAADADVELLVTPETCLTGLFPAGRVTRDRRAVRRAEAELQRFMGRLTNAPHLVAGLPAWEPVPGHRRRETRYNVSRLYAPDGTTASTHSKIHSCEHEFWHGKRLAELEVNGVPITMHICHDGRYPEVWTLPVMFGARLVVHPANGGKATGTVESFEARAKGSTTTSHACYIHVNGGGGSFIAGPQKYHNLVTVSDECRRDSKSFPVIGDPAECLFHANVRIADAFGYWPVRSYRASEEAAARYVSLYESLGGSRPTPM